MIRRNADEDLRDVERRAAAGDPDASRLARAMRIRLGQPRPSDLILMTLPPEAQFAFDHDMDWSSGYSGPTTIPTPDFAPGTPCELIVQTAPDGPGSPDEFYRSFFAEDYEVESSRWTSTGRPAVIAEAHVYSESNGIWEGLGSAEKRDVDQMTIEEFYAQPVNGRPRNPRTRWLDPVMWMRSWQPYDEYVLDTGADPIQAYGLDDPPDNPWARQAERQELARCRLRALLYSGTTPEQYFALVGEAGLRWCRDRTVQWHHSNPGEPRRGSDEELLEAERALRAGDQGARERLWGLVRRLGPDWLGPARGRLALEDAIAEESAAHYDMAAWGAGRDSLYAAPVHAAREEALRQLHPRIRRSRRRDRHLTEWARKVVGDELVAETEHPFLHKIGREFNLATDRWEDATAIIKLIAPHLAPRPGEERLVWRTGRPRSHYEDYNMGSRFEELAKFARSLGVAADVEHEVGPQGLYQPGEEWRVAVRVSGKPDVRIIEETYTSRLLDGTGIPTETKARLDREAEERRAATRRERWEG